MIPFTISCLQDAVSSTVKLEEMLAPEEMEMLQKLSETADKHQHVDIKVHSEMTFVSTLRISRGIHSIATQLQLLMPSSIHTLYSTSNRLSES